MDSTKKIKVCQDSMGGKGGVDGIIRQPWGHSHLIRKVLVLKKVT